MFLIVVRVKKSGKLPLSMPRRIRDIAVIILNLGFWFRWVVMFMPWLPYLQERTPVPIERRLYGPQSSTGRFREEKNHVPPTWSWTPNPPACIVVTILTTLFGFFDCNKYVYCIRYCCMFLNLWTGFFHLVYSEQTGWYQFWWWSLRRLKVKQSVNLSLCMLWRYGVHRYSSTYSWPWLKMEWVATFTPQLLCLWSKSTHFCLKRGLITNYYANFF
jgi:hypothetical protein